MPAPAEAAPSASTPMCLNSTDVPDGDLPWLDVPDDARGLATNYQYAYLSQELIRSGAVDARDCPLGGLWPNGAATGCGLAKTQQAVLYLQDAYDADILAAGRASGVPPVMMKRLIAQETQFWPGRTEMGEFGLGNLTYMGATTAILWNRNLYDSTAAAARSYYNLPGQLLSLMQASCQTCGGGIDLAKAKRSIPFLAQVLMGYCTQTTQILYNVTRMTASDVVDYPTIWRLTLLNYNAGPSCVQDAIKAHYSYGSQLSWTGIAAGLDNPRCVRGVAYSDSITTP